MTWHDSLQACCDAQRVLNAVREAKKIKRPIDLARLCDIPLDRVTMAVAVLECQRLVMQTAYANGMYITPTSLEQQIDHVEGTYGIQPRLTD